MTTSYVVPRKWYLCSRDDPATTSGLNGLGFEAEEVADVGWAHDIRRRRVEGQGALAHDEHAVAVGGGPVEVVGGEEDGTASAVDGLAQEGGDLRHVGDG